MAMTLEGLAEVIGAELRNVRAALGRLPQRRQRLSSQASYGVAQYVNVNAGPVTCVNTPDSEDGERDYCVTWQAMALPPTFGGVAPNANSGVLLCTIEYSQAETNHTIGPFPVVDLEEHTLDLCARRVAVSFQWTGWATSVSAPTAPPSAIKVQASAGLTQNTHGNSVPTPPTWFISPLYEVGGSPVVVVDANGAVPVPSHGTFQAMRGSMVSGSGTGYVMLLDAPTGGAAPGAGAVPLWVSDPLTAGQGYSSFDALQKTAWIYGLWVGLSSTDATFTPLAGTFTCNVAGG